jgi:hypothetical protein
MTEKLILQNFRNIMNNTINKKLNINLNTFEQVKDQYKSVFYPFIISDFNNSNQALIYKYFCFSCSLIEKEIEILNNKKIKINFVRVFNNENILDFKLIIILIEASNFIIESIPSSKYGILIIIKNIIIPTNLENKTIKRLINENLNMTNIEFYNTKLEFLPIIHKHFKIDKLNNLPIQEQKIFLIKCFFIKLYLIKTFPNFKKYTASCVETLFNNSNNNTDYNSKNFNILNIKKVLCCNFINAPEEFLVKIPHELLNIQIMNNNNLDIEIKSEFKIGEIEFDNNILFIKKNKKINHHFNVLDYLFNPLQKFIRELEITFNYKKEHNERYEIKEINNTIICTITKFHKFKGIDADTTNKKKIILKNIYGFYKNIIFKKINLF